VSGDEEGESRATLPLARPHHRVGRQSCVLFIGNVGHLPPGRSPLSPAPFACMSLVLPAFKPSRRTRTHTPARPTGPFRRRRCRGCHVHLLL
jgi:hypothetical protein